jgi:hypothetical protein
MGPKCPACGYGMRNREIHRGPFPCPGCNQKLQGLEPSRFEQSVFVVAGIIISLVIAYEFGPHNEYAVLVGLILAPVLAIPMGAAYGTLRILFFPLKVYKEDGWPDEGTILHITPPPGRPEKQADSK